ncbi:AcvB/VirJ family lysyl-phosphatidylglycerol hydrolase [Sphingobium sp. CR2-8]|uniref:AcvB/VirJ family lysyl-phosphatidylglycerol hydrolase n=1 Tax=Sphingobium sp. CR2-8 TaxID=1306534 RepID=UPI002DC0594C|nr:AcvB/VirJ family lysyl-phosphatidylglycerol hydrolase [Sphingobium sp. CR2-8]MEC3912417.1 AcvB/VirJ family lysyl-phosphatidylglycerol hydrolase [Sphingobium sp. CR2-8]
MRRIIRIVVALIAGSWLVATGIGAPVSASAGGTVTVGAYSLAPFGGIRLYRPGGSPRATALFLSGDGGWSAGTAAIARDLAKQGILVAGVSTPTFMRSLERERGRCINPNYALVALARDVQHRAGVRAYMKPIVIGYSAGATLAYASLAQWPDGAYRAVVSLGFSADMPGAKPWCSAPGFTAHAIAKPAHGWLFAPNRRIKLPWIVVQGRRDAVVDFAAARRFVTDVPHARLIDLPQGDHRFVDRARWMPRLMAALAPMLDPVATANVDDLPLTIVPPAAGGDHGNMMAVIYSGDGGWVGLDRDIASQLAAKGIPVVGVDSLSYFWSQRTPSGAGQDLRHIIAAYSARWNRPRVMVIGYSFGADVLPAIVGTLDPQTRAHISSLSLLGLGATADFQFHLSSWLDLNSTQAQPTVPAIMRLRDVTIRCIRGAAEDDSACPAIPRNVATQVVVPGGHHFGRNAALLANIVLGQGAGRTG